MVIVVSWNITHLLFRNTKQTTGLSATARVFVTMLLSSRNQPQFRDTNVNLWGKAGAGKSTLDAHTSIKVGKLFKILFFFYPSLRRRKCRNVPQIINEKKCVYLPTQSCKNVPVQVNVDIPRKNCTQVRQGVNKWAVTAEMKGVCPSSLYIRWWGLTARMFQYRLPELWADWFLFPN